MSRLEPFKLDLRGLSREMRQLVEQIGKDRISGDYHNPLGVQVDPPFVIHEAEFADRDAEAKVSRSQLPPRPIRWIVSNAPSRKEGRRPRDPGRISPGLRDQMQRAKRNKSFAVALTFAGHDGVRIPLLPDLDGEERREEQVRKLGQVMGNLAEKRARNQRAILGPPAGSLSAL